MRNFFVSYVKECNGMRALGGGGQPNIEARVIKDIRKINISRKI